MAPIIHLSSLSSGSPLVGARTCFIHTHLLAHSFFPVKAFNRRLSLNLLCHVYKTEPAGLAILLVFDNSRCVYLAESFKSLTNSIVRCIIRQVSHIIIFNHSPYCRFLSHFLVR